MEYTYASAEFQKYTSFILQNEIPHVANIFIDDLLIKGPNLFILMIMETLKSWKKTQE